MRFLDILVLLKLDLGQISFNPVENALATKQPTFLASSIAFYHILIRASAEIKIVRYVLRLFDFWIFFSPSFFILFFSFCCSD